MLRIFHISNQKQFSVSKYFLHSALNIQKQDILMPLNTQHLHNFPLLDMWAAYGSNNVVYGKDIRQWAVRTETQNHMLL